MLIPFVGVSLGGAVFGILVVQNPLAAQQWLGILCLLVISMAVSLTVFWSVTAWAKVSAYRSEKQVFSLFARQLGRAERGLFLSGQWIAIAILLLLATALAMAFSGQGILAALLTPLAALAFAALRWSGPARGGADAGLLAYIAPSQFPERGEFAIGWSQCGRLSAARRIAVSRTDNTVAQDFLAALDSGGVIRAAPPEQLFRPISVATLRLATTVPVLKAALPFMLLAWLVAAILPPGLVPTLPLPGDVFSFLEPTKSEPEADSDEDKGNGQEEENHSGAGSQDQGVEVGNGYGESGSSGDSGNTGDGGAGQSPSDGTGGAGASGDDGNSEASQGAGASDGASSLSDGSHPGSVSGEEPGGTEEGGPGGSPNDGSEGVGSSGGNDKSGASQGTDGGDGDVASPPSEESQPDSGSGDGAAGEQKNDQDGAGGPQSGDAAGAESNDPSDQEDAGITSSDAGGGQGSGEPSPLDGDPSELDGESGDQSGSTGSGPSQDNVGQQIVKPGGSENGGGRNANTSGAKISPEIGHESEANEQDAGSVPNNAQADGSPSGDEAVDLDLSKTENQTGTETELDMSIGVTEGHAESGPEIASVASEGNETESDVRVSVETGETLGVDINVQKPQPLFAEPGQAPALVEGTLPARNSPAPSLPARLPHQRVPAWIADMYK